MTDELLPFSAKEFDPLPYADAKQLADRLATFVDGRVRAAANVALQAVVAELNEQGHRLEFADEATEDEITYADTVNDGLYINYDWTFAVAVRARHESS
jgi:hypothetical protein